MADVFLNGTRVAVATEWTLTANRNYVDATVFGDTNRTYFVPGGPIFTYTDGDQEFTMNLPPGTTATTTRDEETGDITIRLNHNGTPQWGLNMAITSTTNTAAVFANVQRRLDQFVGTSPTITIDANTYDDANIFTNPWPRLTQFGGEEWQKRRAEMSAASKRAEELLASMLTAEQRDDLAVKRYFLIKGKKLTYRVSATGTVGTVGPDGWFCIGPVGGGFLPAADRAVGIKLLIEADEAEFLRVANWTGTSGGSWVELGRMGINGKAKSQRTSYRFYGAKRTRRQRITAAVGV